MFTGIKIYCPNNLDIRVYVHTRISGKRVKFYNGKLFGVHCYPNECTTVIDRKRELNRLAGEAYKKLSMGWNPLVENEKKRVNVLSAIKYIQKQIAEGSYSIAYLKDLNDTSKQFVTFLEENKLTNLQIDEVLPEHVELFLKRFTSSGTYYMNKRRFISVTFSKLINLGYLKINPVRKTSKRRVKAKLHEAFKGDQLIKVLTFLKYYNSNLYLCALLMFGTLLRPHREIRLLTRSNFSDDLTYIILDGYRNKSGSIRKTPIPDYVRIVLKEFKIPELAPSANIFTGTSNPFNSYYFNLMWGRGKKKMFDQELINENQTLYSFRHSAAVDVFTRHQNLHLLQKLFAHSSLTVSLTYLRSIGQAELLSEDLLPKLTLSIKND